MMRKIVSVTISLLLILSLANTVYADTKPWVIDHADLLTSDEEDALMQQIEEIRTSYELDVVILTTWGLDGKSIQSYADDYYDDNGYGIGEDYTGVILVVAMETREWYISTCGEAIYALTDYSLDILGQELVYFLSMEEYDMGFENFVNSLPKYMIAYQQGEPYDGYAAPDAYEPEYGDEIVYYEPDREPDYLGSFLISLLIGAVVALVAVLIMGSRMNTAKFQKNAGNYLIDGSYHLNVHRDMFLYSRVSKTPRQQNNSAGRGGGSSVHRSSGGRSHGGRGGRF